MNATPTPMSARRQIAMLKELAGPLLGSWGKDEAEISLMNHGFNTTFKVLHQGQKYALRINMNSVKSHEGVLAEMQIMHFLVERGLPVPQPIALETGDFVAQAFAEPFGKTVDAVLYSWLPGSLLADNPTEAKWHEAGRLMAKLHLETRDWQPTAPAALPRVDSALMDVEYRIGKATHEAITDELRELCEAAINATDDIFARLRKASTPRFIHTDMHGHNLMSNRGKISVFDFDDAGIGFEIQDLANATFYMRDEPQFEAALRAGYEEAAELPRIAEADFETLLAARTVLLLNDLLNNKNPDLLKIIPEYSKKVLWRLQNLRDTGRFELAAR